jgi:uncharacterized membrane protein YcaP (DUF421 family)
MLGGVTSLDFRNFAMTELWHNLFIPEISVLEKILRPVLVYLFLLVGLRLAGKRELAQLNPFDLVVLLTISNTVQNAIIGNDNSFVGGTIGAATLLGINYLVARLTYKHPHFERLVEGDADVLISNGKIHEASLRRELLTKKELEVAAHRQGLASLDEVEKAVLETGGAITFVAKEPSPESVRHDEVLARLDQLSKVIAAVQKALPPAHKPNG